MRRRRLNAITQSKSVATRLVNSVVATPVVTKRYFLPSSLPGCQLWLDAADNSSLVMNETNVTTWRDKSGNGYHMNTLTPNATWTGSATYPTIGTSINGLQTVNFKAQGGLKQSTTLDGVKNLFWVGRIEAPVGSGDVSFFLLGHDTHFDWHSNQYGGRFVHPSATQTGIYNASPTSLFTSDSSAVTNATFSSVNMPSAPNVSLLSVAGITGTTRYQGICYDRTANLGWCGDLAEVITFSTALTTAQRQAVEGYLAHKWGITQYYSPTTPLSIPGCQLWLDAADSTTVTGTTTVTQWRDKSGNSRHLGVRTGTTNYSSNAINLVNSAMFVDSPVNLSNVTMFILAKTTGGNNQTVFTTKSSVSQSYNTLDGFGFYMDGTTSVRLYGQYGGVPSFATNTSTPKLFSYQSSGTSISVWMNAISQVGATLSSSRTSTAGGFGIGAEWTNEDGGRFQNFIVNASIYEIIVYNTVLTITQRETIEKYLMQKWGLGLLPLSHPYANFIPSPLTEFIPKSITGCGLWLDGADPLATGIVPANGATISTWKDKSASGANLTAVGTPTYASASSSVYLNGNSYLQNTNFNFTNHTMFIVSVQSTGPGPLYTTNRSTAISGFFPNYQGSYYLAQANNSWLFTSSPFVDGTTYLYSIQYDSLNNINVWSNGNTSPTISSTAGTITRNQFILGKRDAEGSVENMTGNIFEVVQFSTDLTTTQRQQVEGYLAWKWRLTGSLPAGHPYKAFSTYLSLTNTFLPTLIPGCQIWLDGADPGGGGIQPANGTVLSSWNDKSGFGRHATTAGSAPTYTTNSFNNRQAITLNGSSSLGGNLTGSGTTLTVCIVATQASECVSDGGLVCFGRTGFSDWNDVGSLAITKWASNSGQMVCTRVTNSQTVTTGVSTPFMYILVFDGTFVNSYLNGTIQTPTNISRTGTFAYTQYAIGSRAPSANQLWTGLIGEVIIYHSALTTTERQQVESYLAWKWGLQGSLPSDHTYKFAPPSV